MPLILTNMPCPLCREPIGNTRPLFSTWGVWLDEGDPMFGLCDAVLHWECYEVWEHREKFAISYVDFWAKNEEADLHWHRVWQDKRALITVNPVEYIASTWVHLYETGSRIEVKLRDWADWLNTDAHENLYPLENSILSLLKRTLRDDGVLTAEDVIGSIDWDRKSGLFAAYSAAEKQRKVDAHAEQEESRKRKAHHNKLCQKIVEVLTVEGHACPGCGGLTKSFSLTQLKKKRLGIECGLCLSKFSPDRFDDM